jgi:hypothetical protein
LRWVQRGCSRRLQGALLHVAVVVLHRRAVLYLPVVVQRRALRRVSDEVTRELQRSLHGGGHETRRLPLGEGFVYKWDERSRDWFVCRRSGWLYNSGNTYALSVYAPLGYPGNRWCGSGWYATEAQGSVWHRGAWRTTERLWSGDDFYY